MLMFITSLCLQHNKKQCFNTSYVNVYRKQFRGKQTLLLYVSIHPMLMFIRNPPRQKGLLFCFNTSYVNVYPAAVIVLPMPPFVSIHPMLMFIKWDQPCIKIICVVSIHPMLMFITWKLILLVSASRFQYILC